MRAFEGGLVGFLVGAAAIGGAWIFVEVDRNTPPPPFERVRRDADVPRLLAPPPPPPDAAPAPPATSRPATRARPRGDRPAATDVSAAPAAVPTWPGPAGEGFGDDDAATTTSPRPRARASARQTTVGAAVGMGAEATLDRSFGDALHWSVAVTVDPHRRVGLELGYAMAHGSELTMSSLELLTKWYPQPPRTGARYYAAAGLGWRHVHAPRRLDAAHFPLGAGLRYSTGRWHADARVLLRLATRRALDTAGATAHVGWSF